MKTYFSIPHLLIFTSIMSISGCASVGHVLNPFAEDPPPEAYLGTPNDSALNEDGDRTEKARASLGQDISRYPRAHQPQPVNPVVQPSVVRLMWIPDHLNRNGDLVPSHYYYLKVLEDRWAVTDVFDQEALINGGSTNSASSIPFTTGQ